MAYMHGRQFFTVCETFARVVECQELESLPRRRGRSD